MCFPGRKCYRFLFLPQQVHRTLMTTTVLFTIAGIIVIFVHRKEWSSVSRVINCKSNCNIDVINPYQLSESRCAKNISLFVLSSILKITHVIVLKGKIELLGRTRARFDSSAITKSSSIWFELDYKGCDSSSGRLSSSSHLCRARLLRILLVELWLELG